MTARRVSWWTRYPDPATGPLHVGLHADERGGRTAVVGVEVWTEAPGAARTDLGPLQDPADDLARTAPPGVQRQHLELPLARLVALMADAVASLDVDLGAQLRASHAGPGRPSLYDRAHYEQVAGVYLRDGAAVVATTWGVSASTARGWVSHCRRSGLLEPVPAAQPAG